MRKITDISEAKMKHTQISSSKTLRLVLSLVAAGSLSAIATASAQIVTLNNNNSSATVDLGSQAGMYNWLINGQNQLAQQWFWYRVGSDPTGQHSIDTIGGLSYTSTANTLQATYTSASFSLTLSYNLVGGGVGDWTSDISENISIKNLSAAPLDFHFFQYSDFALAGTSGGETTTIFQDGEFFSYAKVEKAANQLSETIDQPLADRAEADLTFGTRNRLNQGSPYDLNNNLTAGPDATQDATWALQWDFTIGEAGSESDTYTVIKDKKLSVAPTPEPAVGFSNSARCIRNFLARNRQKA